jgi:hypothetical protein
MRTKTVFFEQRLVASFKNVTPPQFQKLHAELAIKTKNEYLNETKLYPQVETFVDGSLGKSEYQVKPYGLIRYEFSYQQFIAKELLDMAKKLSQVVTGRYRDSWFAIIDGKRVNNFDLVKTPRQIVITNDQPYHRKLELTVNGVKTKVRRVAGIVERLRQDFLSKYGDLARVNILFIEIPDKKYIIKTGRRAGQIMTYPALSLEFY